MDLNDNPTLKRALLWGGAIIGVVAIMYGASVAVTSNSTSGTDANLSKEVTEEDWTKGSEEANVTLVEYADFQCPACGSYYPILKTIYTQYQDQVKFVYRHFPITQAHRQAELAGRASEAAGNQGKFWEMHDLIFEGQADWSGQGNAREFFVDYAKQLDLDLEKFENDLDSDSAKQAVANDKSSGLNSGVQGTPSFFLNGEKIQNPRTFDEFKKVLDDAIAEAGS